MPALSGTPTTVDAVQVLPNGNVVDGAATKAVDETNASATCWVKTVSATTLWSSARADAASFTEARRQLLRVDGPQDGERLPVYYVGDGLLRLAGDAWVDAAVVEAIDAPRPARSRPSTPTPSSRCPSGFRRTRRTRLSRGQTRRRDADRSAPVDLPQDRGSARGGRLLVKYAATMPRASQASAGSTRAPSGPRAIRDLGDQPSRDRAVVRCRRRRRCASTMCPSGRACAWSMAPRPATRVEVEFFGDGATRQPGTAWIARRAISDRSRHRCRCPRRPLAHAKGGTAIRCPSRARSPRADFIDAVGAAAQSSTKSTGRAGERDGRAGHPRIRLGPQPTRPPGQQPVRHQGAGGSHRPGRVVSMATWEHFASDDVIVQAPFKAYSTLEQSIDDHGNSSRATALRRRLTVAADARAFAQAIQAAGYATDPDYAHKLIS